MNKKRYRIQFPPTDATTLGQDEVYVYLREGDEKHTIRLHDYDQLYARPGLYEQLVYDRLQCQSPSVVVDVLTYSVSQSQQTVNELRVLDLGAGNGMVGAELSKHGIARLIGVDIIPEAREATERDRPGLYDAYYVSDFTALTDEERKDIISWSPDCLISVAALGFGDIPPRAFIEAFNIIAHDGWLAFNVKETFLDKQDDSGFSRLIRELLFSTYLDLYVLKRYRHRLSIDGQPLYYFALGGRKHANVPDAFIDALGLPA